MGRLPPAHSEERRRCAGAESGDKPRRRHRRVEHVGLHARGEEATHVGRGGVEDSLLLLGSVHDPAALNGHAVAYDAARNLAVLPSMSSDTLSVVSLSGNSPAVMGRLHDRTRLNGAVHATADGEGHALVAAYYSDALTVVDISDPSHPVVSGYLSDSQRLDGATAMPP